MSTPEVLTTTGVLRFVWRNAGGFKALFRSFDFWLAVVVWLLAIPFWMTWKWVDQVISVLPNLLGFTLGGFAIFLGFGSDEFKGLISGREDESPYLSVSSAFMLFVTFQVAALIGAIVGNALYFETPIFLVPYIKCIRLGAIVGGGIGYFLYCLSISMALRAAIRIFRLSRWYNTYLTKKNGAGSQGAAAASSAVSPDCPGP